tara:strand:+ start:16923 stop:17765 length:843 start_codon:yes stop_codon:yes gene_type:complete
MINSKYLQIIGLIIFIGIIIRIDRDQLFEIIKQSNISSLIFAFIFLFLFNLIKSLRWHILVKITHLKPKIIESWKLYNIGLFFGIITPAKLGELGKIAFLKNEGVDAKVGFKLVLIDRFADIVVILFLSILGFGIVFNIDYEFVVFIIFLYMLVLFFILKSKILIQKIFSPLFISNFLLSLVLLYTFISWFFYFLWCVNIAWCVNIEVNVFVLISAFTITGIISSLPIAPAGLGTRDLSLLTLLSIYNVNHSQIVALSMLMFVSILFSTIPGALYWLLKK